MTGSDMHEDWVRAAMSAAGLWEALESLHKVAPGARGELGLRFVRLAADLRAQGAPRQAELAEYFASRCTGMEADRNQQSAQLAEQGPTEDQPPLTVGEFRALLGEAAAQADLLRAYRLLHQYRDRLPSEPGVAALTALGEDARMPRVLFWRVLGVLGLVADDAASKAIGYAEWSTALARQGRMKRAGFHAARAVILQRRSRNPLSFVIVHSSCALVLRAAGALADCVQAQIEAVAEAESLAGVPPDQLFCSNCNWRRIFRELGSLRLLWDCSLGPRSCTPLNHGHVDCN